MSKDPCRPHTGNTQWSMWVCLLTWDCLLHYNFHNMAYKKMFNLVKWGVELKMNWLNWSIPISSGFQFQFNSNSKSFNSIPIQFMLNWIELIINSNSIHELIRAPIMLGCGRCRGYLLQQHILVYFETSIANWLRQQISSWNGSSHVTAGHKVICFLQCTVWCHYNAVNFLTNTHKRHPIARPMGCLLWIQHLIDILPQFL